MVQNPVTLTHRGEASLVIKGPATGLVYLFGAKGASLDVDGRDAPGLIATGWFSASGLVEFIAAAVAEEKARLQAAAQRGGVGGEEG